MATFDYWISFRITNDRAYQARYDALDKAIKECATAGSWDADTSFLCIRSKYSIGSIGGHLKKALNGTTDHLVIRQIGVKATRYINEPGDGFLAFFPEAIKL